MFFLNVKYWVHRIDLKNKNSIKGSKAISLDVNSPEE